MGTPKRGSIAIAKGAGKIAQIRATPAQVLFDDGLTMLANQRSKRRVFVRQAPLKAAGRDRKIGGQTGQRDRLLPKMRADQGQNLL